jgi:hypothetical protein
MEPAQLERILWRRRSHLQAPPGIHQRETGVTS